MRILKLAEKRSLLLMRSNVELEAGQYPITRHLPKTGQSTSYASGDDGDIEAGWWRGRLNSNNKTRFLSKTISGDDVVIDRATGLMWPKDFAGAGGSSGQTKTWAFSFVWAAALNFAGFDDWRLPNAYELISIAIFEGAAPYVHPIFDNPVNSDFWTSTTRPGATTNAYLVTFLYPHLATLAKTFSFRVLAVRDSRL